jgi:hypothetical protein
VLSAAELERLGDRVEVGVGYVAQALRGHRVDETHASGDLRATVSAQRVVGSTTHESTTTELHGSAHHAPTSATLSRTGCSSGSSTALSGCCATQGTSTRLGSSTGQDLGEKGCENGHHDLHVD